MVYIQKHKHDENCVFCSVAAQTDDADSLIITRGQRVFVILNRYPYTSGHLMVVPYEHEQSLDPLDPATRAEMMELAVHALRILRSVYHPEGFNLGINIGAVAGAGIVGHVHMHVVPRWGGDTNFMSTLGETRVLPEALEDTFRRVREAWDEPPG